MTFQFRAILQAVDGPLKGQLCQVIKPLDDGGVDCFCRAFDGTPTLFKIPASDIAHWRWTGGVALLGPKVEQMASTPSPQPSAPPPLNPEELLEPLPPEVKAQPMSGESSKKKAKDRSPAKPDTPKFLYTFTVKNALGDQAEVDMKVREDLKPSFYNAGAIMKSITTKKIPNTKPFTVMGYRKKE